MPAHLKPDKQDTRKSRTASVVVLPSRRSDPPQVPIPRPLKATRQVWEDYWSSDLSEAVDVASDGSRLLRWITYVDEWHRALKLFRQRRMVPGSMGQIRVNPIWKTITDLEGHIAKAEQELGLTPLARAKLGIKFGEAQLTAKDLNRALEEADERDEDDSETQLLEAWKEA